MLPFGRGRFLWHCRVEEEDATLTLVHGLVAVAEDDSLNVSKLGPYPVFQVERGPAFRRMIHADLEPASFDGFYGV